MRLVLTGEGPLVLFNAGVEPVLILLEAGLGDLRGGVNVEAGLGDLRGGVNVFADGGVEGLHDGVGGCNANGGLEREAALEGLVLDMERGDGLSLIGLALLLLDL
jgi:hypothetical protein